MTASELQTILDSFSIFLGQVISLGLGGLTGIAFVLTSNKRWI